MTVDGRPLARDLYPYSWKVAPRLPILGQTWLDRGADYRKARLRIGLLVTSAFVVTSAIGASLVYGAIYLSGGGTRTAVTVTVLLVVVGLYILALLALGAWLGWRFAGSLDPQSSATSIGFLAVPCIFPGLCGASLAVLVAWCLPVPPAERAARAKWDRIRAEAQKDGDGLVDEPRDTRRLWQR